jgi:hypothetical protein
MTGRERTLSEKRAAAGRQGGKVKAKKGFASIPPENLKRISRLGVAARQAKRDKDGTVYGGRV